MHPGSNLLKGENAKNCSEKLLSNTRRHSECFRVMQRGTLKSSDEERLSHAMRKDVKRVLSVLRRGLF